jgi:molecular chaperone Hsp33
MLMGLPGITEQEIKEMYEEFQKITNLTDVLCKDEQAIFEMFNALNMDIIGSRNIQFNCKCNADKVKNVLKSLKTEDLQEFISENGCYETSCRYCGAQYKITKEELNG